MNVGSLYEDGVLQQSYKHRHVVIIAEAEPEQREGTCGCSSSAVQHSDLLDPTNSFLLRSPVESNQEAFSLSSLSSSHASASVDAHGQLKERTHCPVASRKSRIPILMPHLLQGY